MNIEPDEFVEWIDPDDAGPEFVEQIRMLTFFVKREHALVVADADRLALIRGGQDGISLVERGDRIGLFLAGAFVAIQRLVWHTHPRPTGTSQHDFDLLERLRQPSSILYEVRAGPRPTIYFRKERP